MSNKIQKSGGSAGNMVGAVAILGTALTVLEPIAEKLVAKLEEKIEEKIKERAEERKDWVTVPEICSRNMPVNLNVATKALEKINLQVGSSAVDIKNANSKYRNCFDLQVVWTDRKHKPLVKPGTLVLLQYVTSEIIEESQRLFDESEKHKAEVKDLKDSKRNEQKQNAHKIVEGSLGKILKKRPKDIVNIDDTSDEQI